MSTTPDDGYVLPVPRPAYKITPSPASALSGMTPGDVLRETIQGEQRYDYKATQPGQPFSIESRATNIQELREMGVESVELWHRGVCLGIVNLNASSQ